MITAAPPRPASPTNLSRQEAAWRSRVCTVSALSVAIDLTGAPARDNSGFTVRSELILRVREEGTSGLWMDFQGEEVGKLLVNGRAVPVNWDSNRIALPALGVGEHRVMVEARGQYSNTGQGLHRFHDPVDDATYLYTHFEPSDARRAWPCMDQPDLKAPFSLQVVHPESWTLIANGAIEHCAAHAETGAAVTRFAATPPIPTYLTALCAGPWHRVSAQWRPPRPGDRPVPLSWSCRASLARHLDAEELMRITTAGMDLFDQAYAFPYPWGTYDSVLVPEYNIGAMENPGCVTFSEDSYLFRGPVTRAQRAERANTILHEMSHMWFGDLVTPRWWEDTWLKESFADHQGTWAQEAAGFSEAWVSFASSRKAWAYREDSRAATTHPIVATVEDVEAARQAFDGITYAKGAAVLKQLVAHLGQETFLDAARAWFTEHAFANSDLGDFLSALAAASGRDMEAWANAWLRTAGPSILTNEIEVADGRIAHLVLRQGGVDPTTGRTVLRPHTLVVGLYSFDPHGALARTHRLPVTLEGDVLDVTAARGLPAPDLVLVNDEDHTYAVVRPDEASLATACAHLSDLTDPLARALVWSMLHNLMRDARIPPRLFVKTVLNQADDTTEATTLATLLAQALQAAARYAHARDRALLVSHLLGDDHPAEQATGVRRGGWGRLCGAAPGSDAQLVRARAWLEAAGQAALLGPVASRRVAERVRNILEGRVPGLNLDADLRWRALIALARLDLVADKELDAQLAADPGSRGATRHLEATCARPESALKKKILTRLLTEQTLSNDHVDALTRAFSVDGHRSLTAPLTARYLEALEPIWAGRGQEIATRLVLGLFPACGDRADLDAVNAWLVGHAQAPAALRRLMLKNRDDLARCLNVKETAPTTTGV